MLKRKQSSLQDCNFQPQDQPKQKKRRIHQQDLPLHPSLQAIVLDCVITAQFLCDFEERDDDNPVTSEEEHDLCWLAKVGSRCKRLKQDLLNLVPWFCRDGLLQLVKSIHHHCGLTRKRIRGENNMALRLSCEHGQLEVVKYLHAAFKLTVDDARGKDNECLHEACYNGHFYSVEYLCKNFGLTADDIRSRNNFALRVNCSLRITQYLCERYHLTVDDIRSHGGSVLQNALAADMELVKYLHKTFHLTADDARHDSDWALKSACIDDRVEAVQYLIEEFGVPEEALYHSRQNGSALQLAIDHGPSVLQYLVSRFGKQILDKIEK